MRGYLFILLRGMAMGAADIVPGVSGGTIAFITGIYERLINALKAIGGPSLKHLWQRNIPAFWQAIDGNFLLALFSGILISVFTLVRLISYLLEHEQILLWSFFFGLILASSLVIGQKVKKWNVRSVLALLAGIAIALYVTLATPASTPDELWFIFLAGAIAICAMILPGISGSFILLLLRKYAFIVEALKSLDFTTMLVFVAGCVAGLLTFSRLLSWMFQRFHDLTIALLTGFMLGSLNLVWPWKQVVEYRTNSAGEEVPFRFESVWPHQVDGDPQTLFAVALAVGSFVLIYALEKMAGRSQSV